ncbi:D-lactate dehydrogenase [Convivina intestini]|uniref:Quinone-dependent D-lactate dehydrogenase n=1 Tax=Convivina intestini TaxID=1505726 RepID=A0A2U1DEZ8_9LACO|nr:D-lactate dehydrogenase [Convivina intestini]PVY86251.1 D-lactate dehydrogenase [Convivina intestini]CAH1851213.1 Quinone-dependent D-lactate dehydrogenase [Convivina intestini]SDB81874.1 D-lactate dehydrogenase [Leuconostocaceae bacterium R-53105]
MTVVEELTKVVGEHHIVTDPAKSLRYRKGYRSGRGDALAVVLPGTLMELWQVLKVLHDNNIIIIMQASNTSLTEGSIPAPGYDRDCVVVNGTRIKGVQLLNQGKEVLAFPGTTLYKLENTLKTVNREPHSVIGSSNLGASVIGGINNNSGGALIQRGPAYTELSLYAQIDQNDELHLVNHLGIDLGSTPEEIITNLENRNFDTEHVADSTERVGHNRDYEKRVRDIDADTPTRYNADPEELYEVSGSSGKLAAFAVRLDTFPKAKDYQMFYLGTNDPAVFERLRRHILSEFKNLPVSGEYMHKVAYDMAKKYGKDSLIVIDTIGTNALPYLFGMKSTTERILDHIPTFKPYFPDRVLQHLGQIFPNQLPKRMDEFAEKYDHYLQLKMAGDGVEEAREFLKSFFENEEGDYFEATPKEAERVATHRYVTAGVAIRYSEVFQDDKIEILPLDIALPRNEFDWFEHLPKEIEDKIEYKIYYGHFLDHVMHQDYILKKGVKAHDVKVEMLKLLDERNAIYPAEHNVGHLYHAAPALVEHYKRNDPTNSFNPGIGLTTMEKYWGKF